MSSTKSASRWLMLGAALAACGASPGNSSVGGASGSVDSGGAGGGRGGEMGGKSQPSAGEAGAGGGGGDGAGGGGTGGGQPDGSSTRDVADAVMDHGDARGGSNDAAGDAIPSAPADAGNLPNARFQHNVKPQDTDPRIDRWLDDHIAIVDGRVKSAGKLYVFLAGGNGTADSTTAMLDEAAKAGLHTLSPTFATDVLVANVCPKDPDPNCSGNVRKEVLEGMDLSPHLVVTPANSLDNRIAKLLAYLGQHFPSEGWSAYLDGAAVRWSEVIIAGRSLGSSEAACVGMRRAVSRVEMHSGPGDSRLEMHAEAAPWLSEPSLTPPERMWGFSHTLDPGHADQLRAWAALGLAGSPTSVDGATPPYGGSHRLITSFAPPGGAAGAHGSTTAGSGSPKLPDGSYRFAPVWRTMFGI